MFRSKTTNKQLDIAANAVLCVVDLATHGEVGMIEEAEPRKTPKILSRMGMLIV